MLQWRTNKIFNVIFSIQSAKLPTHVILSLIFHSILITKENHSDVIKKRSEDKLERKKETYIQQPMTKVEEADNKIMLLLVLDLIRFC